MITKSKKIYFTIHSQYLNFIVFVILLCLISLPQQFVNMNNFKHTKPQNTKKIHKTSKWQRMLCHIIPLHTRRFQKRKCCTTTFCWFLCICVLRCVVLYCFVLFFLLHHIFWNYISWTLGSIYWNITWRNCGN